MIKKLSQATKVLGSNIISTTVLIIVLFFAGFNHTLAQPADSPWPMYRHDAQGMAKSPYTGPLKAIVKWSCWMPYFCRAPVIAEDGTIYVSLDRDSLFAINPNGSKKWSVTMFTGTASVPSIAADGTIYVQGEWNADTLYAIDPTNGHKKWRLFIGPAAYSHIVIGNDGTIYRTGNWSLYAINPDKSIKWQAPLGGTGGAFMALSPSGSNVYVNEPHGWRFGAIRPFDGSLIWEVGEFYNVPNDPAVGPDGTIYAYKGYNYHHLVALNPTDGHEKWTVDVAGSGSVPAINGDTIYMASSDSNLYAVTDRGSYGQIKWKFKMSSGHWGSAGIPPVIGADGTIYIVPLDGILYAIDPDNGDQKWSLKGWRGMVTAPAIGEDGTIYVGHDRGLYAIGSWLAAYWDCNDNGGSILTESTENAVNGVIHNATWIDNGACGSALSFDGLDDYVEIPCVPSIKPESEITVELWFKMEEYSDSTLLSTAYSGGYGFYFKDDTLVWGVGVSGYSVVKIPQNDISLNKWHCLAGTYDGNSLKVYLDGILKDELSIDGGIQYNYSNSLIIGANCGPGAGPNGSYFKGFIDELRIYSYGLTDSEILDDMAKCHPVNVHDSKNLSDIPGTFTLYQNYPNPFNHVTSIKYDLPTASEVRIIIYNISGQKVETLVEEFQKPGYYSVHWNVSDIGSGVYFYQITACGYTVVKKCIILK